MFNDVEHVPTTFNQLRDQLEKSSFNLQVASWLS